MLVRSAVLVLACMAVFAATASAHKSAPQHVGRCNAHLSKLQKVEATSKVLVWEQEGTGSDGGEPAELLYACLRPSGRSVAIGDNEGDGGKYVSNEETTNLGISGTLVSDVVTTGLASGWLCKRYEGTRCPSEVTVVARVYNLSTGRSIRQPLAAAASAYAFTSLGAIAWEVPITEGQTVLQAVSFDPANLHEGPVETLDTGILGDSLHFTGLTLAWTDAGQAKSQTIP
jgi:hypothetical protein